MRFGIDETLALCIFAGAVVRASVRFQQRFVIDLGVVVDVSGDEVEVLLGHRRIHLVAVDGNVLAAHQQHVRAVFYLAQSLLYIQTREVAARISLTSFLADGPEFLGAEGARDPRSGSTDAGQRSLAESFPAAGFGLARLPR